MHTNLSDFTQIYTLLKRSISKVDLHPTSGKHKLRCQQDCVTFIYFRVRDTIDFSHSPSVVCLLCCHGDGLATILVDSDDCRDV